MDFKKQIIALWATLFVVLVIVGSYQYHSVKTLETTLQSRINMVESVLKEDYNMKILDLGNSLESQGLELTQQLKQLENETTKTTAALKSQISEVEKSAADQLEQIQADVQDLSLQSADFSLILDDMIQSVVAVKTNSGQGSGVIVDSEGYIITNKHVIEGSSYVDVVLYDGTVIRSRVVEIGNTIDLAVLKIEENVEELDYEYSDDVKVGEKVVAIGNPGGLGFSVTEGIISAVNRQDQYGIEYFQTDVAVNPGNSGGPIIGTNQKIVGITTSKISTFEGVGFAIEADEVDEFADPIITQDKAAQQQ